MEKTNNDKARRTAFTVMLASSVIVNHRGIEAPRVTIEAPDWENITDDDPIRIVEGTWTWSRDKHMWVPASKVTQVLCGNLPMSDAFLTEFLREEYGWHPTPLGASKLAMRLLPTPMRDVLRNRNIQQSVFNDEEVYSG